MRILLLILLLSSCGQLIESFSNGPGDELEVVYPKGNHVKEISLIFSHNVNGETHPCGCRNFPLGGIPQIAGIINPIKKNGPLIYLDSGDLLFPTIQIPSTVEKSLKYTADELMKTLSDLGLRLFVPGDQDFAAGIDFLQKVINKNKVTVLLGNAKTKMFSKQIPWTKYSYPPHKIYMTSLLSPQLIPLDLTHKIQEPHQALEGILKNMKKDGYSSKNPFHRLVVISHSGMKKDVKLAKKFPKIDWIIGGHSQSFTKDPIVVGTTKIIQVLSRNHYLGHIKFNLTKSKRNDRFKIIQIHQELQDKIKPNPYITYLDQYKNDLKKIQLKEQEDMNLFKVETTPSLRTYSSCVDCHTKQGEHWKSTPHSLAYGSLLKANEEANLKCLKCHTLGLNKKGGYKISKNIIQFHKTPLAKSISTKDKKENDISRRRENYLNELRGILSPIKSIRKLSSKKRKKYLSKWIELDNKSSIKFNFSNVQCLHCHNQNSDHPFTIDDEKKDIVKIDYIQKCLTCHTDDQSPSWYFPKKAGKASKFRPKLLKKLVRKVSCPSL